MSGLPLKRGKLSHSSGQWSDRDFDVLADGKVVGRILEHARAFDSSGPLFHRTLTIGWHPRPRARMVLAPSLTPDIRSPGSYPVPGLLLHIMMRFLPDIRTTTA
jgi:hypothetical protein